MTFTVRSWGYEAGDLVPGNSASFATLREARNDYRAHNGNEVALVELWDNATETIIESKGWFNNPVRREAADRGWGA